MGKPKDGRVYEPTDIFSGVESVPFSLSTEIHFGFNGSLSIAWP
jgi:hypothetical protein